VIGFIISSVPLIISLLISIIFYKKLRPTQLRYFTYFLIFLLLSDYTAFLYSRITRQSNHSIINVLFLINFPVYFLLFYKILEKQLLKTIVLIFSIGYIIFYFINILSIQGFSSINSYTYSVGSIMLIICCLFYFAQVFVSEKQINYFTIPMFWISTGVMFYYAVNLIYNSLLNYIIDKNIDPHGYIFAVFMTVSNLILYGLFSVGFLCNQEWKAQKS
jgi:hypothetical protein